MKWTHLILFGLYGACGGGSEPTDPSEGGGRPIGQTCSQTDQCAAELDCLAQPDTDEWCEQESYCTVACASESECVAALGEGHICVDACGAQLCFVGSRG